jgi:hypothetical protein
MNDSFRKPVASQLSNYYKDIKIKPYGCFKDLEDKFFLRQLNPYSTNKVYDSAYVISETSLQSDIKTLVYMAINNGYDIFGFQFLHKYPDFKNIKIQDIAVLGKLNGYNYLSISKSNPQSSGKMYLTYSPPLNVSLSYDYSQKDYESALSQPEKGYTLTPLVNNYRSIKENNNKELSCGYPIEGDIFNDNGQKRQYMGGSYDYSIGLSYYSVYEITERT